MESDLFGDRIKGYENVESLRWLNPKLPIIIRLDGRSFSSFTRGMDRPFDVKMQQLMQLTTAHMVKEAGAVVGYTQSDEISLVLVTKPESQVYFGGRVQKMCSSLSATASVFFNSILPNFFPDRVRLLPTFDCRVFNVPSLWEAANSVLWRQLDCNKNSIQMAARSMFSHKNLQDLTGVEMVEKMRIEKNIDWNTYPTDFTQGVFFQKITLSKPFSSEEISKLPEKHKARKNPNLSVERSEIKKVEFPLLSTIKNLPDVLFLNEPPQIK